MDELIRSVVAFATDERTAWAKTKRAWFLTLLRQKELNIVLNIWIVTNPPGITQGFRFNLDTRLDDLRYRFVEEIG